MKQNIRSWALVGAGSMCLMAWPGSGRCQGVYFNADAGVALADNVEIRQFFGPTGGTKLGMDTGARFSASGGWNLNPFLGIEGETGFIYNSFRHVDASLSHVPMLANVVLRYDQRNCNWVPYVGAGAGGDVSIISLDHVANANNTLIADGSEATLAFAWQAFAGVRYRLNPKMSVGAGYKYYSVDTAAWDFAGFNDSIKTGRANVHSILLEFNMKF